MICNKKNQSTKTDLDMIEITELTDKDIKSYDVFHVQESWRKLKIQRYERYFFSIPKIKKIAEMKNEMDEQKVKTCKEKISKFKNVKQKPWWWILREELEMEQV